MPRAAHTVPAVLAPPVRRELLVAAGCLVAVLAVGLGLEHAGLAPLVWVALVGPLAAVRQGGALRAGLWNGVTWTAVFALVARPYLPISPVLVVLGPIVMGTLYGFGAALGVALFAGSRWSAAGVASLWFLVERVKSACGLEFGDLGYTQWSVAPVRGMAAFVGAGGVSWLLWLANALVVAILTEPRSSPRAAFGRHRLALAAALPILCFAVPGTSGARAAASSGPAIDVVCVPGDTTTAARRLVRADAGARRSSLEDLLRASLTAGPLGPNSVVVWPETACQFFPEADPSVRSAFAAAGVAPGTTLLAGGFGRSQPRAPSYNSVFAFDARGTILDRYDKVRLIPFDEVQPLRAVSDLLFDRETLTEFLAGEVVRPLEVPWGKVGVSICFEETFSEGFLELTRAGAEVLVTCANYSYFESPLAPTFMQALARFRATENGRWLVRVCNRGPVELIDPAGERRAGKPFPGPAGARPAALRVSVPLRKEHTVYVRFGHELVLLSTCSLVLLAALRRLPYRPSLHHAPKAPKEPS